MQFYSPSGPALTLPQNDASYGFSVGPASRQQQQQGGAGQLNNLSIALGLQGAQGAGGGINGVGGLGTGGLSAVQVLQLQQQVAANGGGMGGGGPGAGAGGGAGGGGPGYFQVSAEEEKVFQLVLDLTSNQTREGALLELSKKRESYEDLAPILWHAYGVIPALLQEITSVYPALFPPTLTGQASNRVCNALALLQCVASHSETRGAFLQAHIPLFLYPFLNTTSKTRPFEYLRLTSLGVVGALVKNDNSEVISFLLSTEIIPLCLRIMESGSELSKTVAIFILQKILLDDLGLAYVCQTYERFYAVCTVLNGMVAQLCEGQPSGRLLKHVVRCYLRLSDNPRAREALRQCLPDPLRDGTFLMALKDDVTTKRCLATLLLNLSDQVQG